MALAMGGVVFYAAAKQLETVIQAFKESNPAGNQIQVIVINKDFTEDRKLSESFPQAKFFFASFMLSSSFTRKCQNVTYRSLTEELQA